MEYKTKMKMSIISIMSILFLIGCTLGSSETSTNPEELERITQTLVNPPFLPVHEQVAEGDPKVVQVRLVVEEKLIEIEPDGAKIWALTFNGSVPGPIIVVHEGDYVELTLVNPDTNTLAHNIDLHAATGALGGGEITQVAPGQEVLMRFKAIKSGVFVYHCAPGGTMIPLHVVSGMNGAIMVLPRDGLKDDKGNQITYDKAYYIGEQDFYVPKDEYGRYKEFLHPGDGFSDVLKVMRTLTPTHVVFNGAVGALEGKNALKSKVGESVMFIHAQSNRDTRPHLIGGHGDYVWPNGSFNDPPRTNLETWFVPGGAAGAMIYKFRQPGTYVYLNHNLIEAFILGAKAEVNVTGKWNDDLMKQILEPSKIAE